MTIQMQQRQTGVVLVTTLIFLVMLTLLAITSLSTTTMEERMSSNAQEMVKGLQIADSGIQKMFNDDVVFVFGSEYCNLEQTQTGWTPITCDADADSDGINNFNDTDIQGPIYGTAYDATDDNPGTVGIRVKYRKDSGSETNIGRSSNPKMMWSQEFSRYYYQLKAKATSPSGLGKTTNAGALGISKSSG